MVTLMRFSKLGKVDRVHQLATSAAIVGIAISIDGDWRIARGEGNLDWAWSQFDA